VVKTDAVNDSSSSGLKVYAIAQVGSKRGTTEATPATNAAAPSSPAETSTPSTVESKPTLLDTVKSYGKKAGEAATSAKNAAKQKKNSSSYAGAIVMATNSSDSSATGVVIREGTAATVPEAAQVAKTVAPAVVVATVPVATSLTESLARYGSQAAIPDSVKREILTKAGIAIPSGANLDALLNQTMAEIKPAVPTP